MLNKDRMTRQEAMACTVPVCSFKAGNFTIDSVKSAIKDYEETRVNDCDSEFMLVLNKDVVISVATVFTNSEFIHDFQPATKREAIEYNFMGSVVLDIEEDDAMQLMYCSLYFDFDKEDCELRAKVNSINGVDVEELRRQVGDDAVIRKMLDTLAEKGMPVPVAIQEKLNAEAAAAQDPFPG